MVSRKKSVQIKSFFENKSHRANRMEKILVIQIATTYTLVVHCSHPEVRQPLSFCPLAAVNVEPGHLHRMPMVVWSMWWLLSQRTQRGIANPRGSFGIGAFSGNMKEKKKRNWVFVGSGRRSIYMIYFIFFSVKGIKYPKNGIFFFKKGIFFKKGYFLKKGIFFKIKRDILSENGDFVLN